MPENDINNLPGLNPAEIFQPEVFENIKYQSFYFIESIDREGAAGYSKIIEKALEQVAHQNGNTDIIYNILVFWMLRLKVFGFECLGSQDKVDLFKKYLVEIFVNDLDLKDAIFRYVDIFESGSAVTDQAKEFINSLAASQTELGSKAESFKKNNFQPTISNWIKQYQYSINKRGANLKPAAFDMINFINNDVNAKYLNPNELEILKRIFELYNWLLSPVIYVEDKNLTGTKIPYTNKQKFELSEQPIQNNQTPKTPPIIPSPKAIIPPKPVEEISKASLVIAQKQNVLVDLTNKTSSTIAADKPFSGRPVNIQDILKSRYEQEEGQHSGLVIGGVAPVQRNSQPLASGNPTSGPANGKIEFSVGKQEKQQTQAEIDKKLEELEKRVGKNN